MCEKKKLWWRKRCKDGKMPVAVLPVALLPVRVFMENPQPEGFARCTHNRKVFMDYPQPLAALRRDGQTMKRTSLRACGFPLDNDNPQLSTS